MESSSGGGLGLHSLQYRFASQKLPRQRTMLHYRTFQAL